MRFFWNPIFRERGELEQFADLIGGLAKKEGGVSEGDWYPNADYEGNSAYIRTYYIT